MTDTLQVVHESFAFGHFRVPRFEVMVQGIRLPSHAVRDVIQVTYKDNIKEIDGFELLVNNWDASDRIFKYVGSETAQSIQDSSDRTRMHKLFEPSNNIFELKMGYLDELTTMVKGNCTTLEPSFPNGGASTLCGRGLNVLHSLRRKQYTDNYCNKKPSVIAREISQKNEPGTNKKRFPVPIAIDPSALNNEREIEYISQKNQYDIDFLFRLARRVGYVVTTPTDQSRVYFGPSTGDAARPLRQVTYILKWGASLLDFKPTLNAANQVKSVTVNGQNRSATSQPGQRVSEKVTLDDPGIDINTDLLPILTRCDPREEVVVNESVGSAAVAHARALAILLERYKEFVTATGTTIGLPDLRAGMQVQIEGVGSRFSGTYFVTESTHTINDSGYLTKFTARRENPGQAAETG